MPAVPLAEIWRGAFLESIHLGHAVICDRAGIVAAWGDPDAVILPRSSCKMVQALPLIESGAAAAHDLSDAQLALACASHEGAAVHTGMVRDWLESLGLAEPDLRCGVQPARPRDVREDLILRGAEPDQTFNNCSGKHSGFLTLSRHLQGGPEYLELDHPVQVAVRDAFEDVTGETSPGHAIDGCSAPNFATTLHGLARAMVRFATARPDGDARDRAAHRLREAMTAHPHLVAGEGRSCTELMRAMEGRAAIKTGAEGVFVAMLPEQGLGIALKIADGATRGAECAIATLLGRLGVLDPDHPAALRFRHGPIRNWRGIPTGHMAPPAALADWTP